MDLSVDVQHLHETAARLDAVCATLTCAAPVPPGAAGIAGVATLDDAIAGFARWWGDGLALMSDDLHQAGTVLRDVADQIADTDACLAVTAGDLPR